MAYESGWTTIIELQDGLEVSNKLNVAFANIDIGLAAITTLEGRMTNVEAALPLLSDRVSALELFYTSAKADSVAVVDDTWQRIVEVGYTVVEGEVIYGFTFTYSLDSITTSAYFRYSIDGGTTWHEFAHEPTDVTDVMPVSYFFPMPIPAAGQTDTFMLEARKELATDTMIMLYADVMVEQKTKV